MNTSTVADIQRDARALREGMEALVRSFEATHGVRVQNLRLIRTDVAGRQFAIGFDVLAESFNWTL